MVFKKLTISIFIFFVYTSAANAADVYFNDVYPITNDEVNSSTLGTKLTGRNFKFSNNQVQFSGNDVSGTFSYYDFSGNLFSIDGPHPIQTLITRVVLQVFQAATVLSMGHSSVLA